MADTPEQLIADGYHAAYKQRRLDDAREIFTRAVAVARDEGNPALLARALTGLGKIERDLREMEPARVHYEEAVSILRTLDDPLRFAHTIRHVGDILSDQGRLQPAIPCYEESLAVYRAHSAPSLLDLANAVAGYARLRERLGDSEEATLLWQEARSHYATVNVRGGVDEADRRLAVLAGGRG